MSIMSQTGTKIVKYTESEVIVDVYFLHSPEVRMRFEITQADNKQAIITSTCAPEHESFFQNDMKEIMTRLAASLTRS